MKATTLTLVLLGALASTVACIDLTPYPLVDAADASTCDDEGGAADPDSGCDPDTGDGGAAATADGGKGP